VSGSPAAQPQLRVLLAFDSFKGSLTATDACAAAASRIRHRFGDDVAVTSIPLADGGEGSLELLHERRGLAPVVVDSVDAIGRPIEVEYLIDVEGRAAYIEVARVVGLPAIPVEARRPLTASSFGVGLVVADAIRRGAERLVVFLGGSATTDGGAGILTALGARLLDAEGQDLPPGGSGLQQLDRVDVSGLLPGVDGTRWTFVADVEAPLLGPTGAALNYSPQKGATPAEAEALERALAHAADVLEAASERDLRSRPGSGAAGGMQMFPATLFDAEMIPGGPFLAREFGVVQELERTDLVITGEGRFDAQSLDGKVVGTLANAVAASARRPALVVVAGDVTEAERLRDSGGLAAVAGVFSIAESAATLAELQADVAELLARRVAEIVSVVLSCPRQ